MRDYVTLAAAAVNRSGKTDYVLVAYDWTTFDEHGRSGETRQRLYRSRSSRRTTGASHLAWQVIPRTMWG